MRLPLEIILQVGTRLLVAFSYVSRAAHEIAVRELQRHCLYIDSDKRLRRFLPCLEASRYSGVRLPSVFLDITSLYLAPFGDSLDNLPTAEWTRELFCYTRDSLQRLMVDIPSDSLPPWHDHLNVGPVLRDGVCSTDEAGGACVGGLWQCLKDLPSLELAFLTTPPTLSSFPTWLTERPVTVVFAQNTSEALEQADAMVRTSLDLAAGLENRKEKMVRTMSYEIPRLEGPSTVVQPGSSWPMRTALDGELWDVEGRPPTRP
ncbi:hypothetical protein F4810DRAFT_708722 [Camillea tinctor]|nr:hypothetical protein F4810DRAFT_708722 [Camillea tinctor]